MRNLWIYNYKCIQQLKPLILADDLPSFCYASSQFVVYTYETNDLVVGCNKA